MEQGTTVGAASQILKAAKRVRRSKKKRKKGQRPNLNPQMRPFRLMLPNE